MNKFFLTNMNIQQEIFVLSESAIFSRRQEVVIHVYIVGLCMKYVADEDSQPTQAYSRSGLFLSCLLYSFRLSVSLTGMSNFLPRTPPPPPLHPRPPRFSNDGSITWILNEVV